MAIREHGNRNQHPDDGHDNHGFTSVNAESSSFCIVCVIARGRFVTGL